MKALDLFCCGGGASMGLHQAGFEVTGVDIEFHPRYPFHMIVADAMGCPWMNRYELAQAIPPAYARYLGEWALRYLSGVAGVRVQSSSFNGGTREAGGTVHA